MPFLLFAYVLPKSEKILLQGNFLDFVFGGSIVM